MKKTTCLYRIITYLASLVRKDKPDLTPRVWRTVRDNGRWQTKLVPV